MRYPAKFEEAPEGGFVVTFRDIPEAITQGDDLTEAADMASDALLTAMDFYFEDKRPAPMPSPPLAGERLVELPASAWVKVLLLNEMIAQRIRPVDLARMTGTKTQEINRTIDLHHNTKIDTVVHALQSIGKTVEISVV